MSLSFTDKAKAGTANSATCTCKSVYCFVHMAHTIRLMFVMFLSSVMLESDFSVVVTMRVLLLRDIHCLTFMQHATLFAPVWCEAEFIQLPRTHCMNNWVLLLLVCSVQCLPLLNS